MSKEELLKRVNQRSHSRYGVRVTERQIRDWVDEDMLPKAIPHGRKRKLNPDWKWNYRHYLRILQICRIKGSGVRRVDAIRIELWFKEIETPFDLLQKSIINEYRRARKSLLKPISSEFDPRVNVNPPERRERALNHQMGKLSPLLLNFRLSEAQRGIKILQNSAFENPEINIVDFIMPFMTQMGITLDLRPANQVLDSFNAGISGLLGDPEETENSGEAIILAASPELYAIARSISNDMPYLMRSVPKLMKQINPNTPDQMSDLKAEYSAATTVTKGGYWRLMLFVQILSSIYREPMAVKKMQEMMRF